MVHGLATLDAAHDYPGRYKQAACVPKGAFAPVNPDDPADRKT